MILCKKCGKLMGYNSYFGGYYCTSCGKLELENKSTCPVVQGQAKARKILSHRATVLAK